MAAGESYVPSLIMDIVVLVVSIVLIVVAAVTKYLVGFSFFALSVDG